MFKAKAVAPIVAFVLVAGSGAVCAQTVNDRVHQSFLSGYINAGAVFLKRSDPNDDAFVAANPSLTPFVSGGDYDFEFEPGFEGTIGIRFLEKEAVEIRTLQLGSDASASLLAPSSFIGGGFTGPGGTEINTEYETDLSSWEINWRHELNERLTLLGGLRAISLDDVQTIRLGPIARGLYDYENDLLGFQIGAELSALPKTSPFEINILAKAGVYALESKGGVGLFGAGPIGAFDTETEDKVFAGEVGISVGYRATDNILFRAGYQALFISDVGLASDNSSFSLTDPALLGPNMVRDDIFFHGATFGVSLVW